MGREIREDRWRDLAHDRGGSYADRGEGISSKVSFEGGREGEGGRTLLVLSTLAGSINPIDNREECDRI